MAFSEYMNFIKHGVWIHWWRWKKVKFIKKRGKENMLMYIRPTWFTYLHRFYILQKKSQMLIIGSILLLLHQVQGDCSNENKFTSSWGTGANGAFSFKVPESTTTGWKIQVTFDKPVTNLNVWNGQNEQCNGNVCTFYNKNWNKRQSIYIRTGGSSHHLEWLE